MNLSFLSFVLLFLLVQCLAFLSLKAHERYRGWTYLLVLSPYLFFLFFLNAKKGLIFGGSFDVTPLKMGIIHLLTLIATLTTLFNGFRRPNALRNSIAHGFLFLAVLVGLTARDYITLFLSLESQAFLIGGTLIFSHKAKGPESALKYFITHNFMTIFFILAILFFFLATGSFHLYDFTIKNHQLFALAAGLFLLVCLYKLGVCPFHGRLIDLIRTAGPGHRVPFLLMVQLPMSLQLVHLGQNLILSCVPDIQNKLNALLIVMVLVSAAYSSLALWLRQGIQAYLSHLLVFHMGIVAMHMALGDHSDFASQLLFYLIYVLFSFAGLFLSVAGLPTEGTLESNHPQLLGRFYRDKLKVGAFLILLLSFLGLPFTLGLQAQFLVLKRFIQEGYLWASVLIILANMVNLASSLELIATFFSRESAPGIQKTEIISQGCREWILKKIMVCLSFLTLYGGLFPAFYMKLF